MNNEEIGTYNFKPLRRGDTFVSRDIAKCEQPAGTPKAIASARMQVRVKGKGTLVAEFDTAADPATITITGAGNNIVTLAERAPAVTQQFTPGDHEYDLEVVWAAGGTRTILAGAFPVTTDVTRPSA